jgi:Mg-chelatase subunit ChlD
MTRTKTIQDKLRQLDVVFVIDTTGSMGSSISEVQKRLNSLSQSLAQDKVKPNVAFGIVAYRDHPPEDKTYVTRVYPLVEQLSKAQQHINALNADGGGDTPEAVLDGLRDALTKMKWREYGHKVLLLVGDAPPHGIGASGRWPKAYPNELTMSNVLAQATSVSATIHAVGVGNNKDMVKSFTQIAKETGGEFVPLAQIDRLIPHILELLRTELGKVEQDIDVFSAFTAASDKSVHGIANAMGKQVAEVDESLKRLSAKGVSLSAADTAAVNVFASEGTSGATPPAVDPEVLAQIKIDAPAGGTGSTDGDDINIRILDD